MRSDQSNCQLDSLSMIAPMTPKFPFSNHSATKPVCISASLNLIRCRSVQLTPQGIQEVFAFDTRDGLYDCTWSEVSALPHALVKEQQWENWCRSTRLRGELQMLIFGADLWI
jgi:hypothetical protein